MAEAWDTSGGGTWQHVASFEANQPPDLALQPRTIYELTLTFPFQVSSIDLGPFSISLSGLAERIRDALGALGLNVSAVVLLGNQVIIQFLTAG